MKKMKKSSYFPLNWLIFKAFLTFMLTLNVLKPQLFEKHCLWGIYQKQWFDLFLIDKERALDSQG